MPPVSRIKYLSESDMDRIHESTLNILENTGVVFRHEKAREIFESHGAAIDGETVHIPRSLVMEAMKTVPVHVRLYGRDEKYNVLLGEDYPKFHTNSGRQIVYVTDRENGIRRAEYADLVNMLKIMQQSPTMDICGGSPADPSDLPPETKHLRVALANLRHTTKPVHTCVGDTRASVHQVMDIMEMAYGKERMDSQCILITSCTPMCPLGFDEIPLENGMTAAQRGQIVNISPCSISGITGPLSPYAGVIQQNIEFVAGMTLMQLVRPGTPVIYHACSGIGNMKNLSYIGGSPDMPLLNCACNQMARDFYHVPGRANGPFTEAKVCDCQAGYETMMNMLTAAMSGASLIDTTCGSLYNMMITSYEKIIIDEEMVKRVRRFLGGLNTEDHDDWMDVISDVGPGGSYLYDMSTLTGFRSNFMPDVSDWETLTAWQDAGAEDVTAAAARECQRRLDEAPETLLEPEIERDVTKYIRNIEG